MFQHTPSTRQAGTGSPGGAGCGSSSAQHPQQLTGMRGELCPRTISGDLTPQPAQFGTCRWQAIAKGAATQVEQGSGLRHPRRCRRRTCSPTTTSRLLFCALKRGLRTVPSAPPNPSLLFSHPLGNYCYLTTKNNTRRKYLPLFKDGNSPKRPKLSYYKGEIAECHRI